MHPQNEPQAGEYWLLGEWDSDSGLAGLVDIPAGGGDAAADFKMLETIYAGEGGDSGGIAAESRGVDVLLAAARKAECRLTPEHYPEFDRMDAPQPDFLVLRSFLQALLRRASEAERRGDNAAAEECYRAALLCGRHLTRDRSSSVVYMTGLIFKLRGAQGFELFLRRGGRFDQANAAAGYAREIAELLRLYYWKANVALNELPGFASLPAAILVATRDKEPCWRKEALLRLAWMRHGIRDEKTGQMDRNPGYIEAAESVLAAAAANDPDPSVRRMAVWAAINIRPEEPPQ